MFGYPPNFIFYSYQKSFEPTKKREYRQYGPSQGVGQLVDPFLRLPGCILNVKFIGIFKNNPFQQNPGVK